MTRFVSTTSDEVVRRSDCPDPNKKKKINLEAGIEFYL